MTDDGKGLSISRDDRGVAYLRMEAGRLNIFGSQMIAALGDAISGLASDASLRCLVVSGGERAFVGGADIKEMARLDENSAREFIGRLHDLCESVRTFPVPVIARIHGWCFGAGVEFAAACDIRLASEDARLAMPEVKLGIPSVIHAAMLPGLIGTGRTRWWLLTGETIDAARAHDWGLVDAVLPFDKLDGEVDRVVGSIVECPPLAIRMQKKLCNEWDELPLAQATRLSIDAFGESYGTGEPAKAMSRFLDRSRTR